MMEAGSIIEVNIDGKQYVCKDFTNINAAVARCNRLNTDLNIMTRRYQQMRSFLDEIEFELTKSRISENPLEDIRIDFLKILNKWRQLKRDI